MRGSNDSDRRSPAPPDFDSVYVFGWSDWDSGPVTNHQIYPIRWSRHYPVVVLQPDLAANAPLPPPARTEKSETIEIFSILGNTHYGDALLSGVVHLGQISQIMMAKGHRRPLFWSYNAYLLLSYILLPAAYRIYHSREFYDGFPFEKDAFKQLNRAMVGASDTVVAATLGVARMLRETSGHGDILHVNNGVEYAKYARKADPERFARLRKGFDKVCVFAGGINFRIDFPLIDRIVEGLPDMKLVVAGRVEEYYFKREHKAYWRKWLDAPNFEYVGFVESRDIPDLYAACDVGAIPYVQDIPMVRDCIFPLKLLEMTASGLPVVTSHLEAAEPVRDVIFMTESHDEFVDAVGRVHRAGLGDEHRARADAICRRYDYDARFDELLDLLESRDTATAPGAKAIEEVVPYFEPDVWGEMLEPAINLLSQMPPDSPLASLLPALQSTQPWLRSGEAAP